MPLALCGQAIAVCEACSTRAKPLYQLSSRLPSGRLVVAILCRDCHVMLAPQHVAGVHR